MNTCKKCGTPLLSGSKFCGTCGTAVDKPIVQICPTCRNEVSEGFIFCNKCGTRLASHTICATIMVKSQRRLVLKLGDNPRVSFKVEWPGTILETVYDAQILERQ